MSTEFSWSAHLQTLSRLTGHRMFVFTQNISVLLHFSAGHSQALVFGHAKLAASFVDFKGLDEFLNARVGLELLDTRNWS